MRRSVLSLILLAAPLPGFATGFFAIGLPGSQLSAMSSDGRSAAGGVIGGESGGFRWHAGEPARLLPGAVSARAISASGRYVAGSSLSSEQREVATYWDDADVPNVVGGLPGVTRGNVISVGYGINDEPKIVGTAATADRRSVAFYWSDAVGVRPLADSSNAGNAVGISNDGERVFGWVQRDGERHGVLWLAGNASEETDVDAPADELTGANRAATILFGVADDHADRKIPYRWMPGARAEPITYVCSGLPCPVRLGAGSDDGSIAVGTAGNGGESVAVVWTATGGMQSLNTFLAAHAIAVPAGWTLSAATALSSDGRHIGGFGLRNGRFDSFIADLPDTMPAAGPSLRHSTPP